MAKTPTARTVLTKNLFFMTKIKILLVFTAVNQSNEAILIPRCPEIFARQVG